MLLIFRYAAHWPPIDPIIDKSGRNEITAEEKVERVVSSAYCTRPVVAAVSCFIKGTIIDGAGPYHINGAPYKVVAIGCRITIIYIVKLGKLALNSYTRYGGKSPSSRANRVLWIISYVIICRRSKTARIIRSYGCGPVVVVTYLTMTLWKSLWAVALLATR